MATLATATEKKPQMSADEKPERKPVRARVDDKFKIFGGTSRMASSAVDARIFVSFFSFTIFTSRSRVREFSPMIMPP